MSEFLANLPHDEIAAFCRHNGIRRLALFGSILRHDFGPDSDVDVLVEFEPERRIGFLGLAQLESDLSEIIGRRVDLHTVGEMGGNIGKLILSEAKPLYDAA